MRAELAKHGQEHLLNHWDSISTEEKKLLMKELQELDFKELNEYFNRTVGELESAGQKLDDRLVKNIF